MEDQIVFVFHYRCREGGKVKTKNGGSCSVACCLVSDVHQRVHGTEAVVPRLPFNSGSFPFHSEHESRMRCDLIGDSDAIVAV